MISVRGFYAPLRWVWAVKCETYNEQTQRVIFISFVYFHSESFIFFTASRCAFSFCYLLHSLFSFVLPLYSGEPRDRWDAILSFYIIFHEYMTLLLFYLLHLCIISFSIAYCCWRSPFSTDSFMTICRLLCLIRCSVNSTICMEQVQYDIT